MGKKTSIVYKVYLFSKKHSNGNHKRKVHAQNDDFPLLCLFNCKV